ncbi:MAG: 50S ribosomal protein L25 [candidate division WWE3 bacterium GW2011_GWA1_42_12]|nr:MAG: 50S ribosomal protein L25 [candidate division WWE3 bacterium GW2011_GWA1_42_12]
MPAVIFGKALESLSITVPQVEVEKAYNAGGETTLIDIKIGNQTEKVLFKEVQEDPLSGKIIHVGFYKPNLKELTEAQVPVEIIGEENNEFLKTGGAIVLILANEIAVEALPTDLPHAFEIDVSDMQIGDVVTAGQLKYDTSKVSLVDLEAGDMVIKLDKIEEQVEEEAPVSEEEALEKIEATEETTAEEGEEDEEGKEKKEKKEDK